MDSNHFFTGRECMGKAERLMPPGLRLHWFPRLGSTNVLALEEAWPQGTVIAADSQDRGRGRLGRVWQSPPGLNLYFSLVFYPSLPRQNWGGFSLAAGVALGQALIPFLPEIGLKWPNDLLASGGKLGGILLEASGDKLVAGIGLNVNQRSFPPELNARSLLICTGKEWRRDRLLALLAAAVNSGLNLWDQGRSEQVLSQWRKLDIVLGKPVTAARGREAICGQALDVGPEGQLIVEDDSGVRHFLRSGEVTLKGPKA